MSEAIKHEELVELLQEGKIGYLRFVLEGESEQDYLEWCRAHGTDPSDESAEFYVEQTDIMQMERQLIDDGGLWHLELTRHLPTPARRP